MLARDEDILKAAEDWTKAGRGVALDVTDFKLDDDWLYVVVTPSRPGIRASDHANLMSKIERELGWSPENSFEQGLRNTVKWYCREFQPVNAGA